MLDILIGAAAVCIIFDVVSRYWRYYEILLPAAAGVVFVGIAAAVLLSPHSLTASSKTAAQHALAGSR